MHGMRVSARGLISLALSAFLSCSVLGCSAFHGKADLQSNGESLYPPVSYDGRYVAFYSEATNLVARDTNDVGDIFIRDVQDETTTRVSVNSQGKEGNLESTFPSLSGNGRYVAFTSSAANLVQGDTNERPDVFVHDRKTGDIKRVSVSSGGEQSQGVSYSYFPAISAEGEALVFASDAGNLVPGDTNGTWDVFVHDLKTGTTTLVSKGSNGSPGNGPSLHGVISGNGRYVAFHSFASNLAANDTNGVEDVFVHDRESGLTIRASVDSQGRQSDKGSDRAAISHDGSVVAFSSAASNLVPGDTNGNEDVFIYSREARSTERVSVGSGGRQSRTAEDIGKLLCCAVSPACCIIIIINDRKSVVSADGGHVVYRSNADDLVQGDRNGYQDIFVYDRRANTTTRISIASYGVEGNRESVHHGISLDGRLVAFSSKATNLVAGDTNGVSDIFLHDRQTGTTTRVSVGSRRHRKEIRRE